MTISIDFETRSTTDLRKTGVYPYAEDPNTDFWCMAYAIDAEDPELWFPGMPFPDAIREHAEAGGDFRAWNAQFERVLWNVVGVPRYGFPKLAREQWFDTAAEAAALALPRGLGDAAKVLGLKERKDGDGRQLMLQMARPRRIEDDGTVVWWDDSERLARLSHYCLQDVRVERAVAERIRPLGENEREVYLLDQHINDRGVLFDSDLIRASRIVVKKATKAANAECERLTGGSVTKVTKRNDLMEWLQEQGVDLDNLQKATVRDLLATDDLEETAREVLRLRFETAKTSTAKLKSMQAYQCADERARGMLLYHGASTGRWSGKGPQPQNYPRPEIPDPESHIPKVLDGSEPSLTVISSMLRSMLIATPGTRFVSGDFSQIEARVLAWLAGQDDLLETFRQGGLVYEGMASKIYGVPVEDVTYDQRQIGKMTILGAGFGMGHEKFADQVQTQAGMDIDLEEAKRAIDVYRAANDRIKQFWYDLENAAMSAVYNPGTVARCGKIRYTHRGQFLWCILPSGRPLAYAKPAIRDRKTPWGDMKPALTYMGVNSYTRKWQRIGAYGGLLTENVVQATARDLMADAMLRVDAAGYPVVLTVHDEILTETPESFGSLDEFKHLMTQVPGWAEGVPVAADVWEGDRYRK